MRTERERRLAALAAGQHQIVTRAQLRQELGLTPAAIDSLVHRGRLVVLRAGVYVLSGCSPDVRGAIYAATVGTRVSAGSHRAAAELWRMPGREPIVEVASPRWRRVRGDAIAGFPLVVHESYHLTARDIVEIDGIWRTRADRTLVDLGASVALGHLELETLVFAVQDAVRRNLTDIAQLEATFARLAPHIRLGAREFRAPLDSFQPVLASVDSPPEVRVGRVLLAAGYRIVPQYELKLGPRWTVRLDFYLPDVHHGVEVSPFSTHGGAKQREYDIARALRVRRLHGIEISVVGDDEIARGCPALISMLHTLPRAA
ncbi:MAG TPA: type IV toxin-antitoxin system AbiEi family antitoxin domain-containing protein [Acidimicrobiia bacterium]